MIAKWLVGLLALACILFVTDCSLAEPEWRGGVITDKVFIAQTIHVSSHDGHTNVRTDGPYYYLVAKAGDRAGRMVVTQWTFDQWQIGDECQVEFRIGRLASYGFLAIRRP